MTATARAAQRADDRAKDPARIAHDIIDTDTYPLHAPDSAGYRALVRRCREQAEGEGCVVIEDFVRPEALKRMEAESEALAPTAHYNDTYTNPYNSADDPSLPDDHPKRIFADRTNAFVAGDRIAEDTWIRRLYHDPGVQQLVADCLGVAQVYEYADPLAGLVVNVLQPNCQHPWHFDTNEFIVTMMTKQPEAGGSFDYCPGIRSPKDENFQAVSEVVQGDHARVKSLDVKAGDLQIFFGRYSLHRVSRVQGQRERHTLILGYAKEPGVIGKAERTRKLFGRVAPVHEREAERAPSRSDKLSD
jgi:hypothetical protein